MYDLSGQIIDSNGCTFAFSEYNTKCMYFQWTRKKSGYSKIKTTDQFDHVGVKKQIQKNLKWLLGGLAGDVGSKTQFCVSFLL